MNNPQRLIPGARAETSALFDLLLNKPIGHTFSYGELTKHVRIDVRHEGHAYLSSAIRRLQNQHGQVWLTDTGVGVYRAADEQRVQSSLDLLKRGFRSMGRAQRRLVGVNYDALPDAVKREHNAVMLAAQTARLFTGKVGLDKLRKVLPPTNEKQPDAQKVLDLFRT